MTRDKAYALRALIEQAATSLPDEDALNAVEFYPYWKPDTHYEKSNGNDFRVRDPFDNLLYRLIPNQHDSQEDWPPHLVPAIWTKVEKPGQGDTPDDPIPYSGNMELHLGKYYSEDGIVYRCIRDTGIAVHNRLADLIGIYVEVAA